MKRQVTARSPIPSSTARRRAEKPPRRPLLPGALALLFAAVFTACLSAPSPTPEDLGRLQGNWDCRGPGGECSVTIAGNSLRFYARTDFWYETTFTLPPGTDPKQLHATIIDESAPQQDIGTVVVALYEFEDGQLTLGVLEDLDGPPAGPVAGDWDRATDRFYLSRPDGEESRESR